MSGFRIGAVLIAGPTASGKSALGIRLAQALNGVVINADSMQVYRDLRVITARPTPEEEAGGSVPAPPGGLPDVLAGLLNATPFATVTG